MSEGFIDNFSTKSKNYSFSRPTYPQSLFKFLFGVTPQNNLARDCATGNGQACIGLAKSALGLYENLVLSKKVLFGKQTIQ